MTMDTAPAEHLTDGELVCHLDDELLAPERERVLAHTAACGGCARRLGALEARSEALSEWLARTPAPRYGDLRRARTRAALAEARKRAARPAAPARTPARWPLRAAASIAILLAAAFTVEPVRAWITEQWEGITAAALAPIERAAAAPDAVEPVREESALIAFDPVGDAFVLELQHPQRQGTLTLRVAEVARATAQVVGPGAGGMLVLPNGIRIENEPGAEADYLLTLPERTRLLRLRIGNAPEVTLLLEGSAAAPLVLDLGELPLRGNR